MLQPEKQTDSKMRGISKERGVWRVREDKDEGQMVQVKTGWGRAPGPMLSKCCCFTAGELAHARASHSSCSCLKCLCNYSTGANDTTSKRYRFCCSSISVHRLHERASLCWFPYGHHLCWTVWSRDSSIVIIVIIIAAFLSMCFSLVPIRSSAGHSACSRPARSSGLHGVSWVLPPWAVYTTDREEGHAALLPHTG